MRSPTNKNNKDLQSPRVEFNALCKSLGIEPQLIHSISQIESISRRLRAIPQDSREGKPRWIFRAEKFGDKLTTTLERAVTDYFGHLEQIEKVEPLVFREFRRRAHHYIPNVPHEEDTLQWLALMQHFGAPTRLMDWTYSVFVALFFAVARKVVPNSGYAIWAIEAEWLRRASNSVLHAPAKVDLLAQKDEKDRTHFDKVFRPPWKEPSTLEPLVYPVNPFRLNERLTIQQGVFLCPRQLTIGFIENLKALKPTDRHLKVFEVSAESRTEILQGLDRMNMSNATLFPGLQGFAESLFTKPICYFPPNQTYREIR